MCDHFDFLIKTKNQANQGVCIDAVQMSAVTKSPSHQPKYMGLLDRFIDQTKQSIDENTISSVIEDGMKHLVEHGYSADKARTYAEKWVSTKEIPASPVDDPVPEFDMNEEYGSPEYGVQGIPQEFAMTTPDADAGTGSDGSAAGSEGSDGGAEEDQDTVRVDAFLHQYRERIDRRVQKILSELPVYDASSEEMKTAYLAPIEGAWIVARVLQSLCKQYAEKHRGALNAMATEDNAEKMTAEQFSETHPELKRFKEESQTALQQGNFSKMGEIAAQMQSLDKCMPELYAEYCAQWDKDHQDKPPVDKRCLVPLLPQQSSTKSKKTRGTKRKSSGPKSPAKKSNNVDDQVDKAVHKDGHGWCTADGLAQVDAKVQKEIQRSSIPLGLKHARLVECMCKHCLTQPELYRNQFCTNTRAYHIPSYAVRSKFVFLKPGNDGGLMRVDNGDCTLDFYANRTEYNGPRCYVHDQLLDKPMYDAIVETCTANNMSAPAYKTMNIWHLAQYQLHGRLYRKDVPGEFSENSRLVVFGYGNDDDVDLRGTVLYCIALSDCNEKIVSAFEERGLKCLTTLQVTDRVSKRTLKALFDSLDERHAVIDGEDDEGAYSSLFFPDPRGVVFNRLEMSKNNYYDLPECKYTKEDIETMPTKEVEGVCKYLRKVALNRASTK